MDRAALIVDAGGAGNEQHDDIAEFELQGAGKRTRLGVLVGLVQHSKVRNLLLLNGLNDGVGGRNSVVHSMN